MTLHAAYRHIHTLFIPSSSLSYIAEWVIRWKEMDYITRLWMNMTFCEWFYFCNVRNDGKTWTIFSFCWFISSGNSIYFVCSLTWGLSRTFWNSFTICSRVVCLYRIIPRKIRSIVVFFNFCCKRFICTSRFETAKTTLSVYVANYTKKHTIKVELNQNID